MPDFLAHSGDEEDCHFDGYNDIVNRWAKSLGDEPNAGDDIHNYANVVILCNQIVGTRYGRWVGLTFCLYQHIAIQLIFNLDYPVDYNSVASVRPVENYDVVTDIMNIEEAVSERVFSERIGEKASCQSTYKGFHIISFLLC